MVESFLFSVSANSNEKADLAGTFERVCAARVGFLGYRIERRIKASCGGWTEVYEDKDGYIFGAIVTRTPREV